MPNFPDQPGVYLFKDKAGTIIYIGKAKSLKRRIASYFSKPADSPKLSALLDHLDHIEYICTASEIEALLLENRLIKKHQPKYNILLRDDKNYPYLKLTIQEEWPRLMVARKKLDDGSLYFGQYDSQGLKETVRLIQKLFPIRRCKESPLKKRQQPCLQYHIKRCLGPCIGGISKEEYRGLCLAIASLLSGKMEEVVDSLEQEMKAAAANQNFELAAKLRNQILKLQRISKVRPGWMPKRAQRSGQETLLELKKALGLPGLPHRIEAFDVSNLQGKATVASMVVFENGQPRKSDYRRFKIRSVDEPNDVAALSEAVSRRYYGSLKEKLPLPDLIIVDGGIPQVNAAKKALLEGGDSNPRLLGNIPIFGLAKKEELLFSPGKRSPLRLSHDSPALLVLRGLRDEAHRFAISYHKILRSKKAGL